ANTYRFSSQEYHQPSGLSVYLYRAYDPNLQRWLSRDPIGELGGLNLYGYVGNSPVNTIDSLGLFWNLGDGKMRIGYTTQGGISKVFVANSAKSFLDVFKNVAASGDPIIDLNL